MWLQNCYFLPCCFIWTKGVLELITPLKLPSHMQNLTFGRQKCSRQLVMAGQFGQKVMSLMFLSFSVNAQILCMYIKRSSYLKSILDAGYSVWPFCTTIQQFASGFTKQSFKIIYITDKILIWDWVILIFLSANICGFILVLAQEKVPLSISKTQFLVIMLPALPLRIAGSGSNCSAVCKINAQVKTQSNSLCFPSQSSKFHFG